MSVLVSTLVPIIVLILVALIIVWAAERFSPDEFITKVVKAIVFAGVLIYLLTKFVPMVG